MRWFYTRTTGFCFNGVKQTGVFTTDISTSTRNNMYAEAEVGTHDVVAQIVCFYCIVNCSLEQFLDLTVLTADINITIMRVKNITCNCHTFDDAKRIFFQQNLIFKGSRFAFVGIADNVFWISFNFIKLFPLFACWIGSAAASQKFCINNFIDDLHWSHAHCFFQSRKTAVCDIVRHRVRTDFAAAGCQKLYCLRHI